MFPFGVSRNRLEEAISQLRVPAGVVRDLREADAVVTLKNYYRRRPQPLRDAENHGIPIYVLRSNTVVQMANLLQSLFGELPAERSSSRAFDEDAIPEDEVAAAIYEAEEAIHEVMGGVERVDLRPQVSWIRRLQHQLAERYNVESRSRGRDPLRYVEISRGRYLS